MDTKQRRLARKAKLGLNKQHAASIVAAPVGEKKDRKTKNRESAMLSRERKNAKMKSLELQNEILRQENINLRRMLYSRQGSDASPTAVSGETAPWKLVASEHKPAVFIKL